MPRAFLASSLLAATLFAGIFPARAANLEVGPDQAYKLPSAAIAAAKSGDHVVIAPGEYFDCAIVTQSNITIEGSAPGATAVMTDKACGGKAILVTAGDNITLRNITLARARVPDGNGAGIRAEGANLTVDGVKFINNQNGILAASNPASRIIVRNSEFDRNGACEGACSHGIYVNEIPLLHIENSKFFETKIGHHIKSRALRTEVIGCTITDGENGTSSYLIDVPNGGALVVRDTTMEKGPHSDNPSMAIEIGIEGVTHPTSEITIAGNSFRNDTGRPTIFVRNVTATEAMLTGNKISGGPVEALHGDGSVK
jgi:hypothetical protein